MDKSADHLQAHRNDPRRTTKEFGLSPTEQILIINGDRQKIAEYLDLPFRDFDAIDSIEDIQIGY